MFASFEKRDRKKFYTPRKYKYHKKIGKNGKTYSYMAINQKSVETSFLGRPLKETNFSLKEADFDKAIQYLNDTAQQEQILPLSDLYYILKKYQGDVFCEGTEKDVLFLYHYIKNLLQSSAELTISSLNNSEDSVHNADDIHYGMIRFYISHIKYFRQEEVIEKAKIIFNEHPSALTKVGLIRLYQELKSYHEAWHLCKESHELELYRCDTLYETYFKILYEIPRELAQDSKEGITRLEELWEEMSNEDKEKYLGTCSYRELIGIYKQELDLKKNTEMFNILLKKVKEIYIAIPENKKNDHVRRAMLKILMSYDTSETVECHFQEMLDCAQDLTTFSIKLMIKYYYDKSKYLKAVEALKSGCQRNYFKEVFISPTQLNLHNKGTTGGGIAFQGGQPKYFLFTAIYYFLQNLKLIYDEATEPENGLITVKIITGKGKGFVKQNVCAVLKLYDLKYADEKNNSGCVEIQVDYFQLKNGAYDKFQVASSSVSQLSHSIAGPSSQAGGMSLLFQPVVIEQNDEKQGIKEEQCAFSIRPPSPRG